MSRSGSRVFAVAFWIAIATCWFMIFKYREVFCDLVVADWSYRNAIELIEIQQAEIDRLRGERPPPDVQHDGRVIWR